MADIDFSSSFPPFFTFPVSIVPQQTQCHHISIIDDNILEGTEHFKVVLRAQESAARISVGTDHTTVTIDDNDSVTIGFMQTEFSVDEDGSERDVRVCVGLEGEISREVLATISSRPGTAGCKLLIIMAKSGTLIIIVMMYHSVDDFVLMREEVTFLPVSGSGNQTRCVLVSVQADKFVEGSEMFSLVLSSSDAAVSLSAASAVVTITDNDGKFSNSIPGPTYSVW